MRGSVKGKGSFYIAQYPVRWIAQSASHFLPSLTDLFIPTPFSASLGSILAMQQLRAKTKSLTFPPLSIARYSFIQLSQQGRQWREGKCPIFQTVPKGESNPGSHDCESGTLPLSHRAPRVVVSTAACHAAGRGSLPGPGTLLGVKTWLSALEIVYLCLSEETVKAVGPFYLVSMPGEVKDATQGVNV